MPPTIDPSVVSFCPCGTQSSATGSCVYPRVEDNSSTVHLQIEAIEDSLQFQIDEDVVVVGLSLDVYGLSIHAATLAAIEGEEEGQYNSDVHEDESDKEEGDDDKEEEEEGSEEEEVEGNK